MEENKEVSHTQLYNSRLRPANNKGQYVIDGQTAFPLLHAYVSLNTTDDPLLVQEPERQLALQTDGIDWQSTDLCTRCQSINLTQISSINDGSYITLRVSKTSTCPLCRFLVSKFQLGDVESEGLVTIQRGSGIVEGIDHVCVQHDDQLEYIVQILDGHMLKKESKIGYRHIDPSCVDYQMIREWIGYCRGCHGEPCQMLTPKPVRIEKFRLLDCQTEGIVECTEFYEYVALSYVWGHSSVQQHALSSAVIKDAMHVTMQLGFRYMWVDQLCIDQGNKEDMTSQLGQMNTIYNQASVTIVAAAGENSSYGLPGVGHRLRTTRNMIKLDGRSWKYPTSLTGYQLGDSKWLTRGWTYQESVFSRRCIIFADDQVFFQCGSMSCAEELIEDFTNCTDRFNVYQRMSDVDSDPGDYLPKSRTFINSVEEYSKRELTYDYDVMRAMDGVFGYYARLDPSVEQLWGLPLRWVGCRIDDYLTGRQKHDDVVGALLWAMQWEPAWGGLQDEKADDVARRNGFPSWSWSGWKVEVRWKYPRNTKDVEENFTVPLSVETTIGAPMQVNDEFARSLVSGHSYSTLGLTCVLRITTEVFDLPFVECEPYRPSLYWGKSDSFPVRRKGQHWVTKEETPHEGSWTHFVVQKNIGSSQRGLVWSLHITNGGKTSVADLAFNADTVNLTPMILRCIVISHECGMIVQSCKGISKRVGLLRFNGEFFENGRLRSNEHGWYDQRSSWPWAELVQSRDLRDHFSSVVRTIRLG